MKAGLMKSIFVRSSSISWLAITSKPITRVSFKVYLFVALGHTPRSLKQQTNLWKKKLYEKKKAFRILITWDPIWVKMSKITPPYK